MVAKRCFVSGQGGEIVDIEAPAVASETDRPIRLMVLLFPSPLKISP